MGNSEVGHTNLGAGRIVYQDLVRINRAVEEGALLQEPRLRAAAAQAKAGGSAPPAWGSSPTAACTATWTTCTPARARARARAWRARFMHAFTRRARHAAAQRPRLRARARAAPPARPATARSPPSAAATTRMDRDKRWDRVALRLRRARRGEGPKAPRARRGDAGVVRGEGDRRVRGADRHRRRRRQAGRAGCATATSSSSSTSAPTARARSPAPSPRLTSRIRAAAVPRLCGLRVHDPVRRDLHAAGGLRARAAAANLPGVVAHAGLAQLRSAETEKYAHVTFFFNGGREVVVPERGPDPRAVAARREDLRPEAGDERARGHATSWCRRIDSGQYDFTLVNFANPDMVGHTGHPRRGHEGGEGGGRVRRAARQAARAQRLGDGSSPPTTATASR